MNTASTFAHLGSTAQMGPRLRAEVERQLLADLAHYGIVIPGASLDWSESCQEGHCTSALDGNLEELSNVAVFGSGAEPVAEGWIDFVHGGGSNALFVFWLYFSVQHAGKWTKIKSDNSIPQHVWENLPEVTKQACASDAAYDSRWSNDPKVQEWQRSR